VDYLMHEESSEIFRVTLPATSGCVRLPGLATTVVDDQCQVPRGFAEGPEISFVRVDSDDVTRKVGKTYVSKEKKLGLIMVKTARGISVAVFPVQEQRMRIYQADPEILCAAPGSEWGFNYVAFLRGTGNKVEPIAAYKLNFETKELEDVSVNGMRCSQRSDG